MKVMDVYQTSILDSINFQGERMGACACIMNSVGKHGVMLGI